MYKLIATDLDGTLLDSNGEVSKKNNDMIKKAKDRGIKIVIATGRTLSAVNSIANEIDADYAITGNGAIVHELNSRKMLYNQSIPKDKVISIVEICDMNDIHYTLSTEKYLLSKKLKCGILYYYHENSKKPEDKKTNINIVENVLQYIKENDVGKIVKITIDDENRSVFNGILKKIKEINRNKCAGCFKYFKKAFKNRNRRNRT